MHLIVGLGNPGPGYDGTRHNVGFMFLDEVARDAGISINQNKFQSDFAKGTWQGFDVVLLKPLVYMNLSGGPVRDALTFFKLPYQKLIVVFDDLDLAPGAVKMRVGGGHGGHNGMRDILAKVGGDEFHRIKIGIGKPEHKSATANYVLGKLTQAELDELNTNSFRVARERLLTALKSTK